MGSGETVGRGTGIEEPEEVEDEQLKEIGQAYKGSVQNQWWRTINRRGTTW